MVRDYDALNPAAHPGEPSGRGSTLERLLDCLQPAFEGGVPPTAYVWGPKGAGKSALVTALFDGLARADPRSGSSVHTTTRVDDPTAAAFAYVDARRTNSEFGLRRAVADALTDDPVPKQGVGGSHLRTTLEERFGGADRRAVVAVDHLCEPGSYPLATLDEFLDGVSDSVSWLAVGRPAPDALDRSPARTVRLTPYRPYVLVDVLTSRVSLGLDRHALAHDQLRRIAEWADGDAHDALAVAFGAATTAAADAERVAPSDVEIGMESVPRPSTAVGRVLSLPESRQRVLRRLIDLDAEDRRSVQSTADAVARSQSVDLSAATVQRVLYELAEAEVVRRVTDARTDGLGRPPSRVEPRFPTLVFRRLFDARRNGGA